MSCISVVSSIAASSFVRDCKNINIYVDDAGRNTRRNRCYKGERSSRGEERRERRGDGIGEEGIP